MPLSQILRLPASEITGWEAYFQIYPFTLDGEDQRMATTLYWLVNTSGKSAEKEIPLSTFLPNYLGEVVRPVVKSDPLQRAEYAAFKAKLKSVRPDLVKEKIQ